jgi:medium-chain acyl-[acyl-carrier-protein] hydrolase
VALTAAAPDEWFVSTTQRLNPSMTVVAFPQAGGGCATFAQHGRAMPDWLELVTLNLPGRHARFCEQPRTEIDPLIAELATYWSQRTDACIFFGYCSGALLAYRLACALRELGSVLPRRLVVGAAKAPHVPVSTPLAELDSQTFWEVLADNRSVPVKAIDSAELRDLTEPALRADLALVGGYRHTLVGPLPFPITVLAGEDDDWLTPEDLVEWDKHTARGFEVHHLPTGHWFMEEDLATSVAALVAEAEAARGGSGPMPSRP